MGMNLILTNNCPLISELISFQST